MSNSPKPTIVAIPPPPPSPLPPPPTTTTTTSSSSSTTKPDPPPVTSVDPLRKQTLLLEARRARIEWVDESSKPHCSHHHLLRSLSNTSFTTTTKKSPSSQTSNDTADSGINLLRSSRACEFMKSAPDVISSLYTAGDTGLSIDDASERVSRQLSGQVSAAERQKIFGSRVVAAPAVGGATTPRDDSYASFIKRLRSPEAAEVVQGMRSVVSSFEDYVSRRGRQGEEKSRAEFLEDVAKKMEGTFEVTLDSLRENVIWKEDTSVEEWEETKKSLDIFLYSKVYGCIWKVICEEGTKEDEALDDRMEKLQFVTPAHLEIECFGTEGEERDWNNVLKAPIASLRQVHDACSPTAKLAIIHEAYKQLSQIIQDLTNTPPGADDILPVLIFTLIRARLRSIYSNLQFVDVFSPKDNNRGAEWYAFTNLYGAVQFLKELDMDNAKGLQIDIKEWKEGLNRHTKNLEESRKADHVKGKTPEVMIPVREVREARLRGETVDLNWGLRWQKEHLRHIASTMKTRDDDDTDDEEEEKRLSSKLPDGFDRSYTFLGKEPDDIRCGDIKILLDEYHQLVRTCEFLLVERNAMHAAENKRIVELERFKLESNVKAVNNT